MTYGQSYPSNEDYLKLSNINRNEGYSQITKRQSKPLDPDVALKHSFYIPYKNKINQLSHDKKFPLTQFHLMNANSRQLIEAHRNGVKYNKHTINQDLINRINNINNYYRTRETARRNLQYFEMPKLKIDKSFQSNQRRNRQSGMNGIDFYQLNRLIYNTESNLKRNGRRSRQSRLMKTRPTSNKNVQLTHEIQASTTEDEAKLALDDKYIEFGQKYSNEDKVPHVTEDNHKTKTSNTPYENEYYEPDYEYEYIDDVEYKDYTSPTNRREYQPDYVYEYSDSYDNRNSRRKSKRLSLGRKAKELYSETIIHSVVANAPRGSSLVGARGDLPNIVANLISNATLIRENIALDFNCDGKVSIFLWLIKNEYNWLHEIQTLTSYNFNWF